MAFVDSETHRIVVRVVYDGPGMAGKTTNVRELYGAFRGRTRSELISPGQAGGRTVFMDWLQVDTGLVAGRNLSCHFITVPGQKILAQRRRLLLGLADTVVFVCSAERNAIEENIEMFASLRRLLEDRNAEVPVLVQLNKQDHPEAISATELRRHLELPTSLRLVTAQANQGVGVRETAVHAIRAAADRVQNLVLRSGIESLDDPPGDAESLADAMRNNERIEGLLETRIELESEPPEAITPLNPYLPDRATLDAAPEDGASPPLPAPEVASGMIWPANDGRDLLRRALHIEVDLATPSESRRLQYDAGMWSIATDPTTRYTDLDQAKAALLSAARRSLQLGDLRFPQLALCLAKNDRGDHWLWRIAPGATSIRDAIAWGFNAQLVDFVELQIRGYVNAVRRALALREEVGFEIDLSPDAFCLVGDHTYYLLDDRLEPPPSVTDALSSITSIPGFTRDMLDTYGSYVRNLLPRRFADEVLEQLGKTKEFIPGTPTHVSKSTVRRIPLAQHLVPPSKRER